MTRPTGMSAAAHLRHPATLLGIGAALLNINFVIETLLPGPAEVRTTMVSDLAVHGRPWFWLFRVADAGSAVLLIALSVLALRVAGHTRPEHRWSWRTAVGLLVTFATSTIVAAIIPENCPVGECVEAPGLGWQTVVHDLVSTVGTAAGIAACLAFAVSRRRHRFESLSHLTVFIITAALGSTFVVAQITGTLAELGYPQRAQILVLSLWFVLVGRTVDTVSHPGTTVPSATIRPPT